MYKFVAGIVVGMTIVPLFYLAEQQIDLGYVYSAVPILIACAIALGAWYVSFKVYKDE